MKINTLIPKKSEKITSPEEAAKLVELVEEKQELSAKKEVVPLERNDDKSIMSTSLDIILAGLMIKNHKFNCYSISEQFSALEKSGFYPDVFKNIEEGRSGNPDLRCYPCRICNKGRPDKEYNKVYEECTKCNELDIENYISSLIGRDSVSYNNDGTNSAFNVVLTEKGKQYLSGILSEGYNRDGAFVSGLLNKLKINFFNLRLKGLVLYI